MKIDKNKFPPKKNASSSNTDKLIKEIIDKEPNIYHQENNFYLTPRLWVQAIMFRIHYEVANGRPIMIVGPTGSGKSLFVKIFETLFKRQHGANKKVKEINCSFLGGDPSMVRSELFGHEIGAFTGAVRMKTGVIGTSDLGAIILEEIGDLPDVAQAHLLRFIETKTFSKVGGEESKKADVQIVGVTNDETKLREDFRYRFQPFYVQPLHEWRVDILFHIALNYPELFEDLLPWETLSLLAYNWPGNYRELDRVLNLYKVYKISNDYLVNMSSNLPESFLFNIDKRQTELHGEHINYFNTELKEMNIDINFLERFFNKYYLGFNIQNRKSFFKGYQFPILSFDYLKEWTDIFEMPIYFPTPDRLDRIHDGFKYYCNLFYQDVKSNSNLLFIKHSKHKFNDFQNPYEEKAFRPLGSLRKKVIEYLSDISVPLDEQSQKPYSLDFFKNLANKYPSNPFFINITGKTIKIDEPEKINIFGMTRDNLLRFYYKGLLERTGGNKSEASRMAGREVGTAVSEMKKLGLF